MTGADDLYEKIICLYCCSVTDTFLRTGKRLKKKKNCPENNWPTSLDHKAREFQKNIYLCSIDYSKAFEYMGHKKLWHSLTEMGIQAIFSVSWETCMWVKKQQLEPCMEQLTGSELKKEYDKPVYCHHVYLTYTQSTSCERPGWMSYKLELR